MPESDLSLEDLHRASEALIGVIAPSLKEERGVHIETAIAAAGALAGLWLLHSCHPNVQTPAENSMIVSDEVNQRGPVLLTQMSGFCQLLGMDGSSGWMTAIPEEHQPRRELLQLVRDLEAPCTEALDQKGIAADMRPTVAAFAAIRLVKMGEQILPPDIGKALSFKSLLAASKNSYVRGMGLP